MQNPQNGGAFRVTGKPTVEHDQAALRLRKQQDAHCGRRHDSDSVRKLVPPKGAYDILIPSEVRSMKVKCPSCGVYFRPDDESPTERIRCHQCGHVFTALPDAPPAPVPSGSPAEDSHPPARIDRSFSLTASRAAIILIILSGGVGLAVGLNVHPPDQHEFEHGLEKGIRQGATAGYVDGFQAGSGDCEARLSNQQYALLAECDKDRTRFADNVSRERQIEQVEQLNACDNRVDQTVPKLRASIEQELAALHAKKIDAGLSALRLDLEKTCRERLDQTQKEAYDQGLFAGGYREGYDLGIKTGIEQGAADCRRERHDWEAFLQSSEVSADAAGYERGFTAGQAKGIKEGQEQGYKRGYDVGVEAGYRPGYKKGYADGREARNQQ